MLEMSVLCVKCTTLALPGLSRGCGLLGVSRIMDLLRLAGQQSHGMSNVPSAGLGTQDTWTRSAAGTSSSVNMF